MVAAVDVAVPGVLQRVAHDVAHVGVHEPVVHLAVPAVAGHQPRAAQHPQVLGDQGLGDAERLHQLVHAEGAVLVEQGDDGQAQRCGQRGQQLAGGGDVPGEPPGERERCGRHATIVGACENHCQLQELPCSR